MSVKSRSKAAIFRLVIVWSSFLSGSNRPTRRVAGISSLLLGLRSDQTVGSLGFCDAGVKKFAIAVSKLRLVVVRVFATMVGLRTHWLFRSGLCA